VDFLDDGDWIIGKIGASLLAEDFGCGKRPGCFQGDGFKSANAVLKFNLHICKGIKDGWGSESEWLVEGLWIVSDEDKVGLHKCTGPIVITVECV
jgi:hypothetical protein